VTPPSARCRGWRRRRSAVRVPPGVQPPAAARAIVECAKASQEAAPEALEAAKRKLGNVKSRLWRGHGPLTDEKKLFDIYEHLLAPQRISRWEDRVGKKRREHHVELLGASVHCLQNEEKTAERQAQGQEAASGRRRQCIGCSISTCVRACSRSSFACVNEFCRLLAPELQSIARCRVAIVVIMNGGNESSFDGGGIQKTAGQGSGEEQQETAVLDSEDDGNNNSMPPAHDDDHNKIAMTSSIGDISMLSFEGDDNEGDKSPTSSGVLSSLIPQSFKGQCLCLCLLVTILILLGCLTVAGVCGAGLCNNTASNLQDSGKKQ